MTDTHSPRWLVHALVVLLLLLLADTAVLLWLSRPEVLDRLSAETVLGWMSETVFNQPLGSRNPYFAGRMGMYFLAFAVLTIPLVPGSQFFAGASPFLGRLAVWSLWGAWLAPLLLCVFADGPAILSQPPLYFGLAATLPVTVFLTLLLERRSFRQMLGPAWAALLLVPLLLLGMVVQPARAMLDPAARLTQMALRQPWHSEQNFTPLDLMTRRYPSAAVAVLEAKLQDPPPVSSEHEAILWNLHFRALAEELRRQQLPFRDRAASGRRLVQAFLRGFREDAGRHIPADLALDLFEHLQGRDLTTDSDVDEMNAILQQHPELPKLPPSRRSLSKPDAAVEGSLDTGGESPAP